MKINIQQLKDDVAPIIGAVKYHFAKRKSTYAYALIATFVLHFAYSSYVSYYSDESKRLRTVEYHERVKREASKDLSASVTDALKYKASLAYAEACLEANKESYADCATIDAGNYEVKFVKASTGTVIDKPEASSIVPVASAAEAEPQTLPIGWLKNSQWQSKSRAELRGNNFEWISASHKVPLEYWYEAERKYKVKKEVALCIAWADSGLGRYLKSTNNIGNVGNNDRGDTVHYDSLQSGVDAIFKVLNNKYLKHKQSIGSLSPGGGGNAPFYATSKENWDNNVRNCLSVVHGQAITKDFTIRLK